MSLTSPTSRRTPAKAGLVEGWLAGTARSTHDWATSFAIVAAAIVVEKSPAAFGATFAFTTSPTVPSQRRSTLAVLPLDVPVTTRLVGPVVGKVMYEGSAGDVIRVAVGAARAGPAKTPSAPTARSARIESRFRMTHTYPD